jgi:uncharacterized membrane protein YhhN
MTAFVLLTAIALAGLLAAERLGARSGVWVAKPIASTGFVAAALAAGGLERARAGDPYALWLLCGLVLSWWGDVLLIPRERVAVFRAGILSFLLGHVAFVAAFASVGLATAGAGVAALALAGPVVLVLGWLRPHVPADLGAAVHAYVGVITAMVVCAAGAVARGGDPAMLLGAGLFYVSDLAVARDRFVSPGFANAAWGLPLYYGAQLVLAGTLAAG